MTEALYGPLSALGRTLITSAAAYRGPLQIQRRAFAADAERSETTPSKAENEQETARQTEAKRANAAHQEAETERAFTRQQAEQLQETVRSLWQTQRETAATNQTHTHKKQEIELAPHTGLRNGELFGLRCEDLDLDGGTATIRRTLRHTRTGGLATLPTKTISSERRSPCRPPASPRFAHTASGRPGHETERARCGRAAGTSSRDRTDTRSSPPPSPATSTPCSAMPAYGQSVSTTSATQRRRSSWSKASGDRPSFAHAAQCLVQSAAAHGPGQRDRGPGAQAEEEDQAGQPELHPGDFWRPLGLGDEPGEDVGAGKLASSSRKYSHSAGSPALCSASVPALRPPAYWYSLGGGADSD